MAQVEGRIFFDHGLPATALALRFYHRGYGCKETLLGEAQTDARGSYTLSYDSREQLINLEVRALGGRGEEVPLSAVKYGAQARETFNLVSPARRQPPRAEYDRLRQDLRQLLGETGTLVDAQESSRCQDISLLHRSTRWDARLIALLAVAARLSRETGLGEEVLYGLLRGGLPHKKELLAQVRLAAVTKALTKAVKSNIVSLSTSQIGDAKEAFDKFARETRRNVKATGAASTFAQLLDQSGLTASEQTIFEDLYFNHDGTGADLWTRAEQQKMPRDKIQRLQLQGKLAYLTLNNAALADKIGGQFKSAAQLNELVDQDLYKEEAWAKRLTEIAGSKGDLAKLIPPAYQGETTEDRLKAYSADLARKVRTAMPTRVIGRMIENDELQLGAEHKQLKTPVNTLLRNAEGLGFALGRVPVNTFLQQNKD